MTNEFKREFFLGGQFEINSFQIGKIKIHSSIQDIDISEIVDIFVDYNDYQSLKFSDRLELLKQKNGWVHYSTGASFKIENGTVIRIKLSKRFLKDNDTKKQDILSVFGLPDVELIDDINYGGIDYCVDAIVLVYRQKRISAFIDPSTELLKELHFGTLDEKQYQPINKTSR